MAAAWDRGERPTAAESLAKNPGLDGEAAVRLIYEEVCLRREAGLQLDTSEVVRRYPRWRADLEPLLGADRLLRAPLPSIALPEPGERLGDFRLMAELGRGSAGRTFLAAQPSLADRPVVLKVTAFDHDEHLSLARLQHTHIVPLYSEQVFPERGLRALCMPYLGGATLAHLLDALTPIPPERRRGKDVLDALDRLDSAKATRDKTSDEPAGPYRHIIGTSSYVQVTCLIGACLADALQYAHDRRLVHLDVKTSNVLIASDGQPLLLDFHLAAEPLHKGDGPPERLGGTPGWTSPEQDAAMRSAAEIRDIPGDVDGRSDVYSLGLLILAMLGGRSPALEKRGCVREWLGRINPKVGTGMADIVAHCLEPDPDNRYPNAQALADDLRQHLNDLPLKGVPNRSLIERWSKWRRRRPEALAREAVALITGVAILGFATFGLLMYNAKIQAVNEALEDAVRLQKEHRFDDAEHMVNRGLSLLKVRGFVLSKAFETQLHDQKREAMRGRAVAELHDLAEKVRHFSGSGAPAEEKLRLYVPKVRKAWEAHKALESMNDPHLFNDLRELAIVWAELLVHFSTGPERKQARFDAQEILKEAEAAYGASPALARALGNTPIPAAQTAWEHAELGRYYLRRNKDSKTLALAKAEFDIALDLEPRDFWANMGQGHCAYLGKNYVEALAAFRACVTLTPDQAECRVNQAMAYERLGKFVEAWHDYSKAIELNPELAEARLNRGLLAYNDRRYADAVSDYRDALLTIKDTPTQALTRYNLALALRARNDLTAAKTEAEKAAELGSEDARILLRGLR